MRNQLPVPQELIDHYRQEAEVLPPWRGFDAIGTGQTADRETHLKAVFWPLYERVKAAVEAADAEAAANAEEL